MKKTTLLLIGAVALVVQSASAQPYTLYSDDFEGQTLGNAPQTTSIPGSNAGGGVVNGNQNMWNWVGGGGNGVSDVVWQAADVLDSTGFFQTTALQFGWTDLGNAGSWGFGFSTQAHTSLGAWAGTLSDLTLSFDILVSGTEWASAPNFLAVWADQFPGGVKTLDASYNPTLAVDGTWNHVEFSLDNLVPSGTSGAYVGTLGIEIAFTSGPGAASMLGGDTANIQIDNILLTTNLVPEPSTIALLTLGGFGALVAIRRRRA